MKNVTWLFTYSVNGVEKIRWNQDITFCQSNTGSWRPKDLQLRESVLEILNGTHLGDVVSVKIKPSEYSEFEIPPFNPAQLIPESEIIIIPDVLISSIIKSKMEKSIKNISENIDITSL